MKKILLLVVLILTGCAGTNWTPPNDFVYSPIKTETYEIATWQKIQNPNNKNIHIYIEGDGRAFDAYGLPTNNPTPHGTFMRDMAAKDDFENIVYIARPCQFILDSQCSESDWTTGRFSGKIIDSVSDAIRQIAKNKNITLIGYSGGAMVSGLVIQRNPDLQIEQWITIAGVLNHKQWTAYFGDKPLTDSLDMDKLPDVKQKHFIGERDKVVPLALAEQWGQGQIVVPNATHDNFGDLKIFD